MPDPVPPPPLPNPLHRNIIWRLGQLLMSNIFGLWLRMRARGFENLPKEGGALLLINHQSYLDPLLVGMPLPRPISYLARDSLFRVPVLGWILKNTYVMPISRESASTASLREAIRRLQHGFYVGIFPEGTRTETGAVGPFKPGFLALLRRADVPVIPVGVAGAYEAMPRGTPFLWPGKVRVVFGEALPREKLAAFPKSDEEGLLEYVRQHVIACQTDASEWRKEQA
ncbi:MAG: lysophospholipid acyltransferase family protein [Planctomycetaceae bacterium]|nr:lysophospholipid acyltransferase family protein [Planctomycetaceae bacterium]